MEEKVGCGQTEWRPGRGQELQEQGGALRLAAAGSQVHPQLILWLCHEEGVGVYDIVHIYIRVGIYNIVQMYVRVGV